MGALENEQALREEGLRVTVKLTVGEQHWLPPSAWQACADPTAKTLPGDRIYVGVDVGGERSASAVVWVTEDLRVDCAAYTGNEAVLACAAKVRELAEGLHRRRARALVLYRDAFRCRRCGKAANTVDHVQPVLFGGSDDPSNLQALCAPCNAAKSATPPAAA